jgi:pimeloyl-ACP methyl ester carboxylesterase
LDLSTPAPTGFAGCPVCIRRVEISVNGIRTDAHHIHNWNRRRAHQRNSIPGVLSLAFQHETGVLRSLREHAQHVEALAEQISDMAGRFQPLEVSLAGHSFGTTLILEALAQHPALRATSIHLLASAAESDCERNGLNQIVERRQVERVYLYGSERDWAMFAAQVSQFIFGWRGKPKWLTVRYGDLGKRGWFATPEWDTTMALLDR